MKAIDLTNIPEAGESQRPAPGAYICTITSAEDVPDKEYLIIGYDIAEGEYKGYYTKMREDHPDWTNAGRYYKSYKPKALGMFKRMCSAVSKSNGKYVFDGNANADEKTLVGKKIGLVFQEEEYYGNDGNKRTRLIINKEFPINELSAQKVPALKAIKEEHADGSDLAAIPDSVTAEEVPWS